MRQRVTMSDWTIRLEKAHQMTMGRRLAYNILDSFYSYFFLKKNWWLMEGYLVVETDLHGRQSSYELD